MMPKHDKHDVELLKTWTLPSAVTLGSSVRAKGILLEIRARLPAAAKKSIDIDGSDLVLAMAASSKVEFHGASAVVAKTLQSLDTLPIIPREIQDILAITTTERHRWLADGRLPSAGIRTVRLRGRARRITFHVFDPKFVEDLLDRAVIEEWREEDAAAKAENRRRAAYQTKLTRMLKKGKTAKADTVAAPDEGSSTELADWEDFGRDGLLR